MDIYNQRSKYGSGNAQHYHQGSSSSSKPYESRGSRSNRGNNKNMEQQQRDQQSRHSSRGGRTLHFACVGAIVILLARSFQMSSFISKSLYLSTFIDDSPHHTTNVGTGTTAAVSRSPAGHLSLAEITQNPPLGSLDCPPMTSPVYDRVLEDKGTNKIPKIIHFSFISRCVPTEVFADGIQRWKDELPDYSVYFHDDNAIDRFMQQYWEEFPDLHRVMKCMKYKGAMKVDLWRMLITYEFGGIYADIDNVPAQEFQNGTVILPDDTFFAPSDPWNRPSQNIFAMEAEHPIAAFTVQQILRNVLDLKNLTNPKLIHVTGPMTLYDAYMTYLGLSDPALGKPERKGLTPGIYKGFMNKSVHKVERWDFLNPVNEDKVKYRGRMISKKQRAILIGGGVHWKKQTRKEDRNKHHFSCLEYLYRLDHPSSDDKNAANWSLTG